MVPDRWLVDEMLGRLAHYLRFVGCDAVYVRGWSDEQVIAYARAQGRTLVTRDRALSRSVPGSVLLESPDLGAQWLAVRRARPEIPTTVRFVRCSLCNGLLARSEDGDEAAARPPEVPAAIPITDTFYCVECGHRYWEGSHTRRIRAQVAAWERSRPA